MNKMTGMKRNMVLLILTLSLVLGICTAGSGEELVVPEAAAEIEDEAFYMDSAIRTVTLPEGLKTIGERAFAGSGITRVNLPDSLTYIAETAFDDTLLSEIAVTPGTYASEWAYSRGWLKWEDGQPYPYAEAFENGTFDWNCELLEDGTAIITAYRGTGKVVAVPSKICGREISAIGDGIMAGNSYTVSLTVPGTVRRIGAGAFAGIGPLEDIVFEEGVKEIGESAMEDCPNLWCVSLPESLEVLGSKAMRYCLKLEEISLPAGIGTVPVSCFWGCEMLESVTLDEGITGIGDKAFAYCTALPTMTMPDTLTSIGSKAFQNCDMFSDLSLSEHVTNLGEDIFLNCGRLEAEAPEGSTAWQYILSSGVGKENAVLESEHPAEEFIEKTWTYTHPGEAAALRITFSEKTWVLEDEEYITIIDSDGQEEVFTGHDLAGETRVVRGNQFSVRMSMYVGSPARFGFRITEIQAMDEGEYEAYLAEIASQPFTTSIVHGVQYVSGYLGREEEITLPAEMYGRPVAGIAQGAFRGLAFLKRVVIPQGYAHINEDAFKDCTSLTELEIPDGMEEVGSRAFYNLNFA